MANSLVLKLSDEVSNALESNLPIVALESTIISHGLPRPRNLEMAIEFEQAVRAAGAIPATIAMIDGVARVGMSSAEIERIATDDSVVKVSNRDLGMLAATKGNGACTVASTAHIAALAGIEVFATGGLGGVHRGARDTWDESADLPAIAATPVTVVCAGVKSILDVPATLERLETYSIPVVAVGTKDFPGFYLSKSGYKIDWQVNSPAEVAQIMRARQELKLSGGMIVANPVAAEEQLDPDLHDKLLEEGLRAANAKGIRGKDVTPFLLDFFHRESNGESLEVNVKVVLSNARFAAGIASSLKNG
ncbi:MAG: pseudouridine-5-phosphate glycosidase [Actinomycetota bacterium]